MSFVVRGAKSIVRGVTNAVKGVVRAVGKVVSSVLNFVTQPFMAPLGAGANDSQKEAEKQQGVLISKPAGGDTPIPVIYGLRQIGGQMVYFETGADNNKYLWVVYALSEGPIEGVFDISIDDEDITTSTLISTLNSGNVAVVDKPNSRYKDRAVFQFWYGQFVPQSLVQQMATYTANHLLSEAPSWRKTNIMNGVACILARYEMKKVTTQEEADNNPFTGSIPNIKVTVLGKTVSSLVTGAGTENTEWGDYSGGYRERYSTNPAEIILDYLRNPYYGKGLANSEIDFPSFYAAAQKFNQTVTYVNGNTGPILTCNYVLDTGNNLMTNLKILLQGCRSYLPYVKGKYKLRVEDAGNPTDILSGSATVVKVFDKDTILGEINFTGVDRGNKYTHVEVTYVSPTDKWSNQTVTVPEDNATILDNIIADGGRENKGTFTFPSLTNHAMAYDMARLIYNKSRFQQTMTFSAPLEAMELEPGDNIHINSLMLDFYNESSPGTSPPWRIISLRLNNNYSYTVDCVRNPDFIYPHVRAYERDVILPPYIPRGTFIYYPAVVTDISIRPPQQAFRLPGAQSGNPNTGGFPNPQPTNPADPTYGGGVGGPGYTTATPIPKVTEPPPELNDYITVNSVTYAVEGNLVSATISFTQPSHPLYAGVDFWFKRNISTDTAYRTDTNSEIAGAGVEVQHTFQGLIKGSIPYILISRVRYTNGDSSKFVVKTPLRVSGAVTTENPPDYPEITGSGWDLPVDITVNNEVYFSSITAVPSLGAGSARQLAFTVKQDLNRTGFNGNVKGMNIYYRVAGTTYFTRHVQQFDSSYFPGNAYTFTPNLSLGVGSPNPDDASDNFDFIFRFTFTDQTESTTQLRYMGVDIQSLIAPSSDPFISVQKFSEGTGNFSFQTTEQAPPGAVGSVLDIKVGLSTVGNGLGSPSRIVVNIEPPAVADRANWYGLRLRYREIPQDSAVVPFVSKDIFPVPQPTAGIWQFSQEIIYDREYQYVLTPVVNNSGVQAETKYSWLGRGKIHNRTTASDYPATGNWFSRLNFKEIETTQIPQLAGTPISGGEPIPRVSAWTRTQTNSSTPNDPSTTYFSVTYTTSHIAGCLGVYIYRRSYNLTYQTSWASTYSRYYGLGRWERLTAAATGTITLRAPISFEEFNAYHGLPGRTDPLVKTTYPWTNNKRVLTNLAAISGTPPQGWQYLLVAYTSSGEASKGLLLPVILGGQTQSVETPSIVELTSMNGYIAGFQRNLSDFRTTIANADLLTPSYKAYTAPGGAV